MGLTKHADARLEPMRLLRHVVATPAVVEAVEEWIGLLEAYGDQCAAAGFDVVLGGSFARGEPCLDATGGRVFPLSDFDLFVVVPDARAAAGIAEGLTPALPNASRYVLTRQQFDTLQTCLGAEIAIFGIAVTDCDPNRDITLTPRDGAELMLYSIVEFFEYGIDNREETDRDTARFTYRLCRPALLALRSVRVVRGEPAIYHGPDVPLSVYRQLLDWRDAPGRATSPVTVDEIVTAIRTCLDIHRRDGHLAHYPDAVAGSPYSHAPGASYVGYFQQAVAVAFDVFCESRERGQDVTAARRRAWDGVLGRLPIASPPADLDLFVRDRAPRFREQLMLMKLGGTR